MDPHQDNLHARDLLKPALALLGIVLAGLIYMFDQYLMPQYEYEARMKETAERLMNKSPEHRVMIQNYMDNIEKQ